jgi:hypothetical protein
MKPGYVNTAQLYAERRSTHRTPPAFELCVFFGGILSAGMTVAFLGGGSASLASSVRVVWAYASAKTIAVESFVELEVIVP